MSKKASKIILLFIALVISYNAIVLSITTTYYKTSANKYYDSIFAYLANDKNQGDSLRRIANDLKTTGQKVRSWALLK